MSWYQSKWWRFALASTNDSAGIIDADGRWIRLAGSLWFLIERGATS